MRAAVLAAPRDLRVADVPLPHPAAHEVRVRLEGCGVCASNVEPWEGQPWSSFPGDAGGLGHEGWGVVDAVGEDVTTVAPGDRVALLADHSFAEYDVAPETMVARLPAELAGRPFPGEPLGCAFNIFRRADVKPGQWVAIVGIGFLGAVLTRLATDAGAKVVAISRRQESLDLAHHYGAVATVPMHDHWQIIARVKEIAGEDLCQRVIEAVGKQWPLDLATELVGVGGKLVVAGYHQDGPRQVNMQAWNWKGIDVVSAHERDPAVQMRGLREAIDAVASGRLDPTPLYTGGYTLDTLGEALAATRDKPGAFVKALVTFP